MAEEAEGSGFNLDVEEGEEGSGGGERVEESISSENSGPTRSRSEDDFEAELGDHIEDDDGGDGNKNKKRKKYHRHTAEQIREMEAYVR